MTIKVIGKKLPKEREITCKKCRAIIQYTEDEIKEEKQQFDHHPNAKPHGKKYIICPECNEEVLIAFW